MKLTENAKALAREMFKDDEDALLFYANKVEGGVTLGIGVLKAQEEDRVVIVDGMKVVMSEQIEELLEDVEFDAENDQFVINNVGCDDEDCDCGHHHEHHHGEDCGCGHHHEHHHGEDCGCGGHHGHGKHKHGKGCGEGHGHHKHGEECGCGSHDHKEKKKDCDCGCHKHND